MFPASKKQESTTPLMAQYLAIKENYKDCLLFFRLGDFYELFFEDAVQASADLDIALTHRGKHQGYDIPMCGVPAHAYENYLSKLIQMGHKVAICEQVEDPATAQKRGNKGPLQRDVVRVITPGTITEDSLLQAKSPSFLLALAHVGKASDLKGTVGVSCFDLSTGEFLIHEISLSEIGSLFAQYDPKEIILNNTLFDRAEFKQALGQHFTNRSWHQFVVPLPDEKFNRLSAEKRTCETFKISSLDVLGTLAKEEIMAMGAMIDYVQMTQKQILSLAKRPKKLQSQDFMDIDPATRRNLELTLTQSGKRAGSLLDTIDLTLTAGGGRLMYAWISSPLKDIQKIIQRHKHVEEFYHNTSLCAQIRQILKLIPDLERSLIRLHLNRDFPRDLMAIKITLEKLKGLREIYPSLSYPKLEALGAFLTEHLSDKAPVYYQDGGLLNAAKYPELYRLHSLRQNSRQLLHDLQNTYIHETGVKTLKVRFNNLIGYHIEIPQSQKDKVPEDFILKQGLASANRYTTGKLNQLAQDLLTAESQALDYELEQVTLLKDKIKEHFEELFKLAENLAEVDVFTSLAELAKKNGYTRPLMKEGQQFLIKEGFHPVIKNYMQDGASFVANDCKMDEQQSFMLITGPNMAGKSTYLRQNALIIILAQMGSYVPAKAAEIGIVDQVFSRVGAQDHLQAGQSTYMVEMIETAAILHRATAKSFVILDELGRGTATYDGLSIAWAVVEHITSHIHSRTLFATHYHELTVLSEKISSLVNYTVKIKEWEDKIIFLYEIIKGVAEKSYGIHVAKLAGLPQAVIHRAEDLLQSFEMDKDKKQDAKAVLGQKSTSPQGNLVDFFDRLDLNQITPLQALNLLQDIKNKKGVF